MKTPISQIKAHYIPREWTKNDPSLPYMIPWKGKVIRTTREEAFSLIKKCMIFSCYGIADFTPSERLKVNIEAKLDNFDEIGFPAICNEALDRKGTWIITCPKWKCSYPTKKPLQELSSLFGEITECVESDSFPIPYDY